VRQSTPYQVRNNLESKQRQYALEGRAQKLGSSKVVVIDEDLGPLWFRHSGTARLRAIIGLSLPRAGRSGARLGSFAISA
jgi:hypothetical protein